MIKSRLTYTTLRLFEQGRIDTGKLSVLVLIYRDLSDNSSVRSSPRVRGAHLCCGSSHGLASGRDLDLPFTTATSFFLR